MHDNFVFPMRFRFHFTEELFYRFLRHLFHSALIGLLRYTPATPYLAHGSCDIFYAFSCTWLFAFSPIDKGSITALTVLRPFINRIFEYFCELTAKHKSSTIVISRKIFCPTWKWMSLHFEQIFIILLLNVCYGCTKVMIDARRRTHRRHIHTYVHAEWTFFNH